MRRLMILPLAMTCITLSGCQSAPEDHPEAATTQANITQERSPPPMDTSQAPTYGAAVTLTGTLEIDRIPSGKRFQGTWLLPEDGGTPLLLSYRPIEEHQHLVGKRVVVTGRHKTLSPNVQQVLAPHFELTELSLHPDEAPPGPQGASDAIPAAPALSSLTPDRLSSLHGRWVHAQGRALEARRGGSASSFYSAPLELTDGAILLLTLNDKEHTSSWRPVVGEEVTALGKIWLDDTTEGTIIHLSGPNLICAGHVAQCPTP